MMLPATTQPSRDTTDTTKRRRRVPSYDASIQEHPCRTTKKEEKQKEKERKKGAGVPSCDKRAQRHTINNWAHGYCIQGHPRERREEKKEGKERSKRRRKTRSRAPSYDTGVQACTVDSGGPGHYIQGNPRRGEGERRRERGRKEGEIRPGRY